MARPPEIALTYFPHYIDVGKKFERVIARFGYLGKWLWFELLEEIYGGKQGYYMPYAEEDMEYIADKYRAPESDCRAALAMMIERDMFAGALFEKHGILTSSAIQKQYLFMKDYRSILNLNSAYWLLDFTETTVSREVRWSGISLRETPVSLRITPDNPQEPPFSLRESTQSKSKSKSKREDIEREAREELLISGEEPDPKPWMREGNPTDRLLKHLEAGRPDEELPGGILRTKSNLVERGWLLKFFQGDGESKVHDALDEVLRRGYYCTEKAVGAALAGKLDEVFPARGRGNGRPEPAPESVPVKLRKERAFE